MVGDTVNTASRMTSTIKKKNKIRISKSTFELIKNRSYGFFFKYDIIEAKGKGFLDSWFISD